MSLLVVIFSYLELQLLRYLEGQARIRNTRLEILKSQLYGHFIWRMW